MLNRSSVIPPGENPHLCRPRHIQPTYKPLPPPSPYPAPGQDSGRPPTHINRSRESEAPSDPAAPRRTPAISPPHPSMPRSAMQNDNRKATTKKETGFPHSPPPPLLLFSPPKKGRPSIRKGGLAIASFQTINTPSSKGERSRCNATWHSPRQP